MVKHQGSGHHSDHAEPTNKGLPLRPLDSQRRLGPRRAFGEAGELRHRRPGGTGVAAHHRERHGGEEEGPPAEQ